MGDCFPTICVNIHMWIVYAPHVNQQTPTEIFGDTQARYIAWIILLYVVWVISHLVTISPVVSPPRSNGVGYNQFIYQVNYFIPFKSPLWWYIPTFQLSLFSISDAGSGVRLFALKTGFLNRKALKAGVQNTPQYLSNKVSMLLIIKYQCINATVSINQCMKSNMNIRIMAQRIVDHSFYVVSTQGTMNRRQLEMVSIPRKTQIFIFKDGKNGIGFTT